jgi:hypothetical protein
MTITDEALLDALADCVESGETLLDALGRIGTAGGAAAQWTEHVRRCCSAELPVAAVLRASNVLDESEWSLFLPERADAATASLLHVVALRRRRSRARRRTILWGLVGPFGIAALTVILDPITNLVSGGSYFWPVIRGLLWLFLLALGIVVGIPALLRHRRARPSVLRFCNSVPGVRWFAALYMEEELTTVVVPFVDGAVVRSDGLTAAAALLGWSPLGQTLSVAAQVARPASAQLPMGGLEPLAGHLSLATGLAIVGGVAKRRLAEGLAQRGVAVSALLTARLRLGVRVGAYALVVLFSLGSLASMISRGLPGMPMLPGGTASPDQKELDQLMKQLE